MTISTVLHLLLVAFLVIVFPVWDRRETRRLKTSTDPDVRLRAYQKTIGWQLAATALLLATVPVRLLFVPPAILRELGVTITARQAMPIVIGLLIGAVLPVLLTRRKGADAKPMPQLAALDFFLPRGRRERAWFAAMCVTVGVCEEIIFRGFLVRFLAGPPLALGVAAAVAVSAVIFGIDHGYQGILGIVSTGVLALVMTALFFIGGTLWLPIVLHALIDLRVLLLVPVEGLPPASAATDA